MSRKRSLSKNLSRREPDDTEFEAALEEIHEGSDMVCAIVGSAMIESSLMSIIRSVLPKPYDQAALFHDQGAPFYTFKAKIAGAKAFDIFDDEIADDIECIRDVRNQFAHALMKLDFENEHLVAACSRLSKYDDKRPMREGVPIARHRFEEAVFFLSGMLIDINCDNWKRRQRSLNRRIRYADARLAESEAKLAELEAEAASLQRRIDDISGNIAAH